MEHKYIKTCDLKLASVRYYDAAHKGVELSDIDAYVLLEKIGDCYVNVFDKRDYLPIFERSVYPNYTEDGEEYGTQLISITGNNESSPCFVIEPIQMSKLLEKDIVSFDWLKKYVYNSGLFFVDRLHMMREEKPLQRLKYKQIMKADQDKIDELRQYMSSHEEEEKRLVKRWRF